MVKILGPLGNGFTQKDKKAILIGGGIGIPPMLELMKQLDCDKTAVLGLSLIHICSLYVIWIQPPTVCNDAS